MKNLKYIGSGLIVFIIVSVIIELLIPHDPGHVLYWWHSFPGFDLIYGLVGCIVIIALAKLIGNAGLQQREDFYHDLTDGNDSRLNGKIGGQDQ